MFKRGGVWWTRIRHNGKKIQKSLKTADKKLAKSIEAKVRTEIVEGKYFDKLKGEFITVAELVDKYLCEHSRPNKALKTYKCNLSFSKKILQHFGNMILTKVSPKHIAKYIEARRGDGVGDITINHKLRLLKHAYNLAIKQWELIEESPSVKALIS